MYPRLQGRARLVHILRATLAVTLVLAVTACSPSEPTSQRVQELTERMEELRASQRP